MTQPLDIHVTHVNYEGVPNEYRPFYFVASRHAPLAVSAAYAISSEGVTVAYSLTGRNDRFVRATGRAVATERLTAYLEGKIDERDKDFFIRIIPAVHGDHVEMYISHILNQLGYLYNSEPGLAIANAIRNSNPTHQAVSFINEIVRQNVYAEFGHLDY